MAAKKKMTIARIMKILEKGFRREAARRDREIAKMLKNAFKTSYTK